MPSLDSASVPSSVATADDPSRGYQAPFLSLTLPTSQAARDAVLFGARACAGVGEAIGETLKPQEQASHLPGYMYWHPDVFRREMDQLFFHDWLLVGREEEIENPGDYMTLRLLNEPLILVRDKDGVVRAFYNRCAHRGVTVASGQGNAKRFMCPYHAWSYDLQGRLIGAGHMASAQGFDPKSCKLESLAVRCWQGWVFLSFAPSPPSFESFIRDFDTDFGFLRHDQCRLGEKFELIVECNWKFLIENVMDNYHTPVIHQKTIGRSVSLGDRYTGKRGGAGAFTAFYGAKPFNYDEKSRFGPMPWLKERGEDWGCSGHLVPNSHLFGRCDHVHIYVVWPIHPTKSQLLCYQVFPKEFFADPDFAGKVRETTEYNLDVLKEDTAMIESIQDAAYSPYFKAGRMSGKEVGVYNVISENLHRTFPAETGRGGA